MSESRTITTTPNTKLAFLRARMVRAIEALEEFATAVEPAGHTESAASARAEAGRLRNDLRKV